MRLRSRRLGLLAAVVMVIAACGGDSGSDADVSLYEWGVDAPSSVSAGEVTFAATNDGGETHEMVIVRGVAPEDLPVDENGAVIEDDLPEGAFVDEIEDLEAGDTQSLTVDLEAGTYTIFCNITEEEDDGSIESHLANGMVTTVEVTS
jgi:uncharacterized cupredoxin-like copper-binding protein